MRVFNPDLLRLPGFEKTCIHNRAMLETWTTYPVTK